MTYLLNKNKSSPALRRQDAKTTLAQLLLLFLSIGICQQEFI